MNAKVKELAAKIAGLDEAEQKALFERATELSFRNGLLKLSESFRQRLQERGELDRAAEEMMAKLKKIREEIAAREYPG